VQHHPRHDPLHQDRHRVSAPEDHFLTMTKNARKFKCNQKARSSIALHTLHRK
jgi:hypothetical protein